MIKIRCPVCDGCGAVEAWFGTKTLPENLQGMKEKQCPACLGTGIQYTHDPTYTIQPKKKGCMGFPTIKTGDVEYP